MNTFFARHLDAKLNPQPKPENRFQCRHIRTGGDRCQSPALRNEYFCY